MLMILPGNNKRLASKLLYLERQRDDVAIWPYVAGSTGLYIMRYNTCRRLSPPQRHLSGIVPQVAGRRVVTFAYLAMVHLFCVVYPLSEVSVTTREDRGGSGRILKLWVLSSFFVYLLIYTTLIRNCNGEQLKTQRIRGLSKREFRKN